jgi:hypothetical protein
MANPRKMTFFGQGYRRLDKEEQDYVLNLSHSLLFIQNSRGLTVEKRDGEAVIAVKPAIPQETVCQEHNAKK